MYLKLKVVPRLRGSKPAFPGMESSSNTAGCSMNGMAGEIFMENRADLVERVVQRAFLERAEEKPVTGVETKPIILKKC